MPIKVIFINTINPYEEIEYRYPPLGLGYLVSALRDHFGKDTFQFKIINTNIKFELDDFKPDIVGITSVTQNYNIAREYAKIAKSGGFPIIVGGIHISMLPSSLSEEMDLGVLGEGEETIIDIFDLFMRKGAFCQEDLAKVMGIVYRDKSGSLVITGERKPISPLDNIQMPARDLFGIKKHSYLFSSRGCPYRCVFCASSHFWGKVRFFSAEYVIKEIKELIEKYGVNLISFYDDLMIADPQRLQKITFLLKKEGLSGKIKFSINARANLLSEEVVSLLKEMGVVSVGMGLESGNEKILRYLKGNNISVHDNQMAINRLKKYKIAANASFVIGSPDETEEEIMDTLHFIKKSGLSFFDTYVLTPFPGTPIWEYAKEARVVDEGMDWSRLNVNFETNHKQSVIVSRVLSRDKIYKLFLQFQRLRLFIAMKNLLRHPFFFEILGLLFERATAKLNSQKKRLKLKLKRSILNACR